MMVNKMNNVRTQITWLAAVAIFTATTSLAAAQTAQDLNDANERADRVYQECGERFGVPGAIAMCVLKKDKSYGDELEQVYKETLVLSGANKTLLRDDQRSWLKYQETSCKLVEMQIKYEGPNIGRAAAAKCLLKMTLQRLAELRWFIDLFGTSNLPADW
jgi:uncharacterized protein YecT (DUF1311 family)